MVRYTKSGGRTVLATAGGNAPLRTYDMGQNEFLDTYANDKHGHRCCLLPMRAVV